MNIQQFFSTPFWQKEYFGNNTKDYLIALVILLVVSLFFAIFQKLILRRLKKLTEITKTDIDDEIIKIVNSIKPRFYSFLAFYLSLKVLTINEFLNKTINVILIVWFTYQVITAIQILINYIAKKKLSEEDGQSRTAISVISMVVKAGLWTIALLTILSNLGVNITSLIAGLGIGGIAVAMALKNILGDLFASFAIYFDKPFVIGDFIATDKVKGTVEKIGVKTTRLRSPQGEEIVVSNNELTSARIQNFKKLKERRITFSVGVVYNTSSEKLKKIPNILRNIISGVEGARFDRAHFVRFEDSALSFDVAYFVESAEYSKYLDINQEICFKIKEEFENEAIEMAYPTQTIFLEGNNGTSRN
ncbi:MAG: mechanosensitive ion channel family protein [Candidatus Marinimicrobia bacterium]|nr:mechanosensitive ion channel family protein [Candidatus Neomarinimicrobiota bacterium]